jgi:hypothetical protein
MRVHAVKFSITKSFFLLFAGTSTMRPLFQCAHRVCKGGCVGGK